LRICPRNNGALRARW
jgi:hypothetical protein